MEMTVDFPGGARVNAHFGSFTVETDQPSSNGSEGTAPTPFEVFLASLATCSGIYVLGFCKTRGIPFEGIRLPSKIRLEIQLPQSFPRQYASALVRAAESCLVKKTLENPPAFEVVTTGPFPAAP